MKIRRTIKKWAALMGSGALMLQTTACIENAAVVTSVSSLFTAGGVFYIIARILRD